MLRSRRSLLLALIIAAIGWPCDAGWRVAFVGDQGDPAEKKPEKLGALLKTWVDQGRFNAIVYLGDNFYPIGLNEADWPEKKQQVMAALAGVHAKLGRPYVHAVAGNHDYYSRLLFGKIPRGFTTKGNERELEIADWTYHFGDTADVLWPATGEAVQIVFFDSALVVARGTGTPESQKALKTLSERLTLHANDPRVRWRIVVTHHPLVTVGKHGQKCGVMLGMGSGQDTCSEEYQAYVKAFEDAIHASGAKVQIVVSGHDHNLQLLSRKPSCAGCPGVQVVSGSASKLSEVSPPNADRCQFTAHEFGFAVADFGTDGADISFFDLDGKPIALGRDNFRVSPEGRLASVACQP